MTTEQWEYLNDKAWRVSTPEHKCSVGKTRYVDSGTWAIWDSYPRLHAWVDFDPTVAEARAVLRMPGRNQVTPYTREAVHAHIREHGTQVECEAITPWRVGESADIACPGCGTWPGNSSDGPRWEPAAHNGAPPHFGPNVGKRPWHPTCLARVRSRTEAARSGEPEPEPRRFRVGDRVQAKNSGGQGLVNAVSHDGFTVHYDHAGEHNYSHRWQQAFTLVAPAPVQPVEPRPFRVGDRVRDERDGEYGAVVAIECGDVRIKWDGFSRPCWYEADYQPFTLVTPAPEEPAMATNCSLCGESLVRDDVTWSGRRDTEDGTVCLSCFAEHHTAPSEKSRAYDEGGTNPAGFPVMPRVMVDGRAVPVPVDPCCVTPKDRALAGTASVALPFDAFLKAREQQEPEPYDPREGDEVEVATDYGSLPGVVMAGSRDHGVTVRVRSTDGHEIVVTESAYYVTLVRRPGGVR